MLSINSFNFIDGLDGLSTSIFIIIIGNFLIVQQFLNFEFNNLILFYLIIVSLIFILFNFGFGHIKIYLGNSGSIFFGFFTISFLISFINDQNFYYFPLLLFPFLLQYLNFAFVIFIRIIRGRNIFYADKLHIHHLLSELKINNKFILIIVISILFLATLLNLVIFFYLNYIFYIIYNFTAILLYFILHYEVLRKSKL
jgi:UDP-GlcNAc:undecaprenyl-phosphate GlcNAc-1-phosphate transferase